MKKNELFFGGLLVPLDYLMLLFAAYTAYEVRFHSSITAIQPVLYEIPFSQYMAISAVTVAVWLIIFAAAGLYNIRSTRRVVEEVRKVFFACSTGVLAIIILFFLQRDLFSSRFIIMAAYGFALLYVTIARVGVLYIERYLFRKGYGVQRVVLIGQGHLAELITTELKTKPSLGLSVVAHFPSFNEQTQAELQTLVDSGGVDELIQTGIDSGKEENKALYDFCDEYHITFKYAATLFDAQSLRVMVQPIAGVPIVEVQRTPLDGWGRIVKRFFDIIGSLFLIIVLSPVMVLAALVVWIDSGRPIFFTRRDNGDLVQRVGQSGKLFFYFKFRSMKPGTDSQRYGSELQEQNMRKGSPLVKIKDDPRITRVGALLRRTSIDELPELFLVLKGDMSLVGPRPHLPEEVAQYKRHQKQVLIMKPGITGLSQISGRSDLDFEDEVRLDTFYMEHWALWLDVVILLKTPFILLKRRQAL